MDAGRKAVSEMETAQWSDVRGSESDSESVMKRARGEAGRRMARSDCRVEWVDCRTNGRVAVPIGERACRERA